MAEKIPAAMTAATVKAPGEDIHVGPEPVPQPHPHEVLVRFEASEVNFVDVFVRSGAFKTSTPRPFTIGRDIVGVVVEVGDLVTGFRRGQRVWSNSLGYDGRQGTFSEYVVVEATRLYHLPESVNPHDAAIVLHGGGTAHMGLVRSGKLKPGETVVIAGAGGAVGSAAVQLASAMGARVLAIAGQHDFEWCRQSGAEAVFDYHSENRYEEIQQHIGPNCGVDIWWDTSGNLEPDQVLPLLTRGARVLVMAGLTDTTSFTRRGAVHKRRELGGVCDKQCNGC
jgi:NADPH:quinone reductase-like Zn-dependent oxidoreductase